MGGIFHSSHHPPQSASALNYTSLLSSPALLCPSLGQHSSLPAVDILASSCHLLLHNPLHVKMYTMPSATAGIPWNIPLHLEEGTGSLLQPKIQSPFLSHLSSSTKVSVLPPACLTLCYLEYFPPLFAGLTASFLSLVAFFSQLPLSRGYLCLGHPATSCLGTAYPPDAQHIGLWALNKSLLKELMLLLHVDRRVVTGFAVIQVFV